MDYISKVAIVVVTYNRLSLLKECIVSLRKQTYTNFDIVVINNGSTDDTLSWLNGQRDIIVITQKNLGGAGGFFTGMKYVAEHQYDYCWVMDDDVICLPNALEELLMAYCRKKKIGFVCSKVNGINGEPMNVPSVDNRPSPNGYPYYHELANYSMIKVIDATFVSVLFDTATIKEIGLPYKEYFIWGDDTEYTSRISSKYDCFMACRSEVVHKRKIQHSLSFYTETDSNRLNFYFYQIRNNGHITLTYKNWKGKSKWIVMSLLMFVKLIGHFDMKRLRIFFKAMFSLIKFHPVIVYPQND